MLFCGIIYLMAWFPIRINGCFNQNAIFREIHQVVIIQQSFLCQQRTRRGYWLDFLLAIQFVLLQSLTSKYWDPKFSWIDEIHALSLKFLSCIGANDSYFSGPTRKLSYRQDSFELRSLIFLFLILNGFFFYPSYGIIRSWGPGNTVRGLGLLGL